MKTWPASVRRLAAFTLIEIIISITIIGIVTAATYSFIPNAVNASRDRDAISRANSINAAKKAYELRVSTASSNWSAATDDSSRFLLIRDKIPFAESLTLSGFQPSGYSFGLGSSLATKVTISGPSGTITY